MSQDTTGAQGEIRVNSKKLYREETYTDSEFASFRQLIPIKPDGSPDPAREPMFMGMTHVVSEAGPVPVQCHLEAKTLEEAIREFPDAAKKALQQMVDRARELQRRRGPQGEEKDLGSSRIVLP